MIAQESKGAEICCILVKSEQFNAKRGRLVHNEDGERHSVRLGRPRLTRKLKMAIMLLESKQFYFKRRSLLSDDGAKEAPSNGKRDRSWSILSLVDVNALLALCVDVEACLEKPQTLWVRPLWFVGPW